MNKLGIHSFVWTGSSNQKDLEAAIEVSHDLGYELIEFPRLNPKAFDVAALAKRLRSLGMGVAVTMGLPAEGDVSSEDPDKVKRGEALLKEGVAVARDLGATKLGGILFSMHGKYLSLPTAAGWRNSAGVIGRVATEAKRAGVTINLEVVNRFESNLLNTTAQGLKFIADTGCDNVFLHLDTFHMNIEEASPAEAIRAAGAKLGYFHIGENYRGYLGSGTVNFDAAFDALLEIGYTDYLTFESFSSEVVDKDLSITCGIWRDTWKDNVPLARHAKAFIEERFASAERRRQVTRTV